LDVAEAVRFKKKMVRNFYSLRWHENSGWQLLDVAEAVKIQEEDGAQFLLATVTRK